MRRLALACDAGSAVALRVSQRNWFDELLSTELHRLFPGPVLEALSMGLALSRSALLRARGNDTVRASADLACASRVVRRIDAEPARRLGEAFAEAARAYLLYREGRLEDALDCLKSAYLDDLYVEGCGIGVLLMHRVQLINNMIRIESRRGARGAASRIGASVLAYLEKPDPAAMAKLGAPWNEGWRPCLGEIPPPFVCQMHSQIAAEHVLVGAAVVQTAFDRQAPETQVELWTIFDSGMRDGGLFEVADDAVRLLSRGAWPSVPLWRDAATRIGSFIERSHIDLEDGP